MINGCAEHKNPENALLRNGMDGTLATMVLPLIPVIMLQRLPPPPLRPLHVLTEVTFVTLLPQIWLPLSILQSPAPHHIQRLEKHNANSGLKF